MGSLNNMVMLTKPSRRTIALLVLCAMVLSIVMYFAYWTHATQKFTNAPAGMLEQFERIRVGSNDYKVHEDLSNPVLAAKTMDSLNHTAMQFISIMNAKYISDPRGMDSIQPEYRDIVSKGVVQMTKNFKTANMEENIPERSGGDTSYVIDKGEVFAMCLRDPRNNNTVDTANDLNELKFVLLHEMAHLFTSTFGHDTLFWNNFKFMLQEASMAGLYVPINYKKTGHPYCGIIISYSPLYDPDLKEYSARPATTHVY